MRAPSSDLYGRQPRAVSMPFEQAPSGFQTVLLFPRFTEPAASSVLKSLQELLDLQQALLVMPLPDV